MTWMGIRLSSGSRCPQSPDPQAGVSMLRAPVQLLDPILHPSPARLINAVRLFRDQRADLLLLGHRDQFRGIRIEYWRNAHRIPQIHPFEQTAPLSEW